MGERGPTVIIDGGLGSFSVDWLLVQRDAAAFAQVYTFDRAGYGWSDSSPQPRHSQQMVTELHGLLEAAHLQGPLILVGHSLGGLTMQLFADRYPDLVAGAVLVDSAHEEMYQRLPRRFQRMLDWCRWLQYPAGLTARLGLVRLGIQLALIKPPQLPQEILDKFPADLKPLLYIPRTWPSYTDTVMRELARFQTSTEQLRAMRQRNRQPFGDKPLIVLTASVERSGQRFRRFARFSLEAYKQAWTAMQTDLLKLSSNSQSIIAEQSGHSIMVEQPQAVVTAIQQVAEAVSYS